MCIFIIPTRQFDWLGIIKIEKAFPRWRSNEVLNSLYVTLGILEFCFSLS